MYIMDYRTLAYLQKANHTQFPLERRPLSNRTIKRTNTKDLSTRLPMISRPSNVQAATVVATVWIPMRIDPVHEPQTVEVFNGDGSTGSLKELNGTWKKYETCLQKLRFLGGYFLITRCLLLRRLSRNSCRTLSFKEHVWQLLHRLAKANNLAREGFVCLA